MLPPCLCTGREDISCDDAHCDIACPGEPCNPERCHLCWLRLGKPDNKCPSNPGCQQVLVQRESPNLFTRIGRFLTASLQHLLSGLKKTSAEEAARRYDICQRCVGSDGHFIAATKSCKLCGCNLPLKVTWREQKCPIGKW